MNELSENGLVKPKHTNTSLHQELNKRFQKNGKCDYCGSEERTAYALIHGRQYSLDRKDYMELCRLCHNSYDSHTSNRIKCNCESKSKRYQHGRAYETIDRDDATLKICAYSKCGFEFYTTRTSKVYHSAACKLYAFRERNGIVTRQEPHYSKCQREGCENPISEDKKATTKYCSNACRQKVYNDKNKQRVKAEYQERMKIKNQKNAILKAEKEAEKIADDFLKELTG